MKVICQMLEMDFRNIVAYSRIVFDDLIEILSAPLVYSIMEASGCK